MLSLGTDEVALIALARIFRFAWKVCDERFALLCGLPERAFVERKAYTEAMVLIVRDLTPGIV